MKYDGVGRRWLLTFMGLCVVIISLLPYVIMAATSLKPSGELFKTPATIFPTNWEWSNYLTVWSAAPVFDYIKSSLIITIPATFIVLLASTPAAYYVARHRFRGRTAFLLLVLAVQMLAPVAIVIGIFRQFRIFGLIDSYWAIILTDAAFNLAFAVWILTGFFASIPKELEEAAMLDGAGRIGILRRIVLPLAAPGIVTAAVFAFIQVWNEYVLVLTLISSEDKKPLTVGITNFIGQYDAEYQYLFATSIIAIVPVVIMFAIVERKLVSGLTAGAVK